MRACCAIFICQASTLKMKLCSKLLLAIATFTIVVGMFVASDWIVGRDAKSSDYVPTFSAYLLRTAIDVAASFATIFFLFWLHERALVRKINPWIRIPGLLLCFMFVKSMFHWSKFPANFVHDATSVIVFALVFFAVAKWSFPPFRRKRQTLFDGEYDG